MNNYFVKKSIRCLFIYLNLLILIVYTSKFEEYINKSNKNSSKLVELDLDSYSIANNNLRRLYNCNSMNSCIQCISDNNCDWNGTRCYDVLSLIAM